MTQAQLQVAKTLELVRYIKAHGHTAWLCDDQNGTPPAIGVIEVYTQNGVAGQQRVILENPTRQSVREWLGY